MSICIFMLNACRSIEMWRPFPKWNYQFKSVASNQLFAHCLMEATKVCFQAMHSPSSPNTPGTAEPLAISPLPPHSKHSIWRCGVGPASHNPRRLYKCKTSHVSWLKSCASPHPETQLWAAWYGAGRPPEQQGLIWKPGAGSPSLARPEARQGCTSWGRPSHCQPQGWLWGLGLMRPLWPVMAACKAWHSSTDKIWHIIVSVCSTDKLCFLHLPNPQIPRSKKTSFAYTDQGSKGDWQTLPSALTFIRCLPGKLSLIQMHHPSNGALSISFTVTDIPLLTIISNSFHPSSFCCCPHLPVSCLTWWVIPTDLFSILVYQFKPKLDGPCEGCK